MGRSQPASHSFVCLGVPEHRQAGGPGWIQWALAAAVMGWVVDRGLCAFWGHGQLPGALGRAEPETACEGRVGAGCWGGGWRKCVWGGWG